MPLADENFLSCRLGKIRFTMEDIRLKTKICDQASILMVALWALCCLSVLAVSLSYQVRQKITLSNKLQERSKLHFIAEAGVMAAIDKLKNEDLKDYDSLEDAWSNNVSAFKNINVDGGKFNICYNYNYGQPPVRETRWGLVDEESKININKATQPVLERLFRILLDFDEVDSQELAASIVDWRDNDSELSIPLGSAEDSDYRRAEYPYEAKDAEFEILEEVVLVKGMTMDIFKKIKDYITIYGDGKVNINTASTEALLALGLNELLVEKILAFRYGKNESDLSQGNFFDLRSNIAPRLSQYTGLSDSQLAQLSLISQQYLCTKSNNFMIRSVASLENRKNTAELICVVNRVGKILYSQEN